jgi:hypothetical protein
VDRQPGTSRSRLQDAARKLDEKVSEAERRIQGELDQIITYMDQEVVPSVRTHSSRALRVAAEKMSRLADFMDTNPPRKP